MYPITNGINIMLQVHPIYDGWKYNGSIDCSVKWETGTHVQMLDESV